MKFPLKPLHDRVIIFPDPKEEMSDGGIIIPDVAKEKPNRGLVMASGKGLKDLPNETKPGDYVMYGKYAGTEITYEDKNYLIVRESDILVIESKDAKSKEKK